MLTLTRHQRDAVWTWLDLMVGGDVETTLLDDFIDSIDRYPIEVALGRQLRGEQDSYTVTLQSGYVGDVLTRLAAFIGDGAPYRHDREVIESVIEEVVASTA